MGDPARRQRGVCRHHGRRPGVLYQRPHDPQRPLVCLDETSKQLIIDTRAPIPAKPGQPARHDYEYERNGVANLFMVFAPLEGWRHVKITGRHTAIDYAHVLRDLSDTHFPDTAKIVLVQDNLNIDKPAPLYEAFPAPEARLLVERFEWHYPPKHGSWLDLAESELGVLASQCLVRRIADKQILAHEITAWQDHRNKHHAKADWQFTTANARVKLKRLYPQFEANSWGDERGHVPHGVLRCRSVRNSGREIYCHKTCELTSHRDVKHAFPRKRLWLVRQATVRVLELLGLSCSRN